MLQKCAKNQRIKINITKKVRQKYDKILVAIFSAMDIAFDKFQDPSQRKIPFLEPRSNQHNIARLNFEKFG